jgi:hypothetical protein
VHRIWSHTDANHRAALNSWCTRLRRRRRGPLAGPAPAARRPGRPTGAARDGWLVGSLGLTSDPPRGYWSLSGRRLLVGWGSCVIGGPRPSSRVDPARPSAASAWAWPASIGPRLRRRVAGRPGQTIARTSNAKTGGEVAGARRNARNEVRRRRRPRTRLAAAFPMCRIWASAFTACCLPAVPRTFHATGRPRSFLDRTLDTDARAYKNRKHVLRNLKVPRARARALVARARVCVCGEVAARVRRCRPSSRARRRRRHPRDDGRRRTTTRERPMPRRRARAQCSDGGDSGTRQRRSPEFNSIVGFSCASSLQQQSRRL